MAGKSPKKRELIFVALAAIALIYGAVDYVVRSSTRISASGGGAATTEAAFSLIQEELNAGAAARRQATALEILKALSVAWPDDVFAAVAVADEEQADEEEALPAEAVTLTYSGYMNMGEKILAVINGIEYRIGDMVEGFVLKEIDPLEIIVEKNGRPTHVPFRRIE